MLRNLISLATLARETLVSRSGFTVSANARQSVPAFGYLASVSTCERCHAGHATERQLLAYFQDHPLAEGLYYWGGWFHNGSTFLDVSRYFRERANALAYARENGQIAIFDLAACQSVPVAETPERAGQTERQSVLACETPERAGLRSPERAGVLALSGHAGQSGLQNHSVGGLYPWSIVGVGQTLAAWQLISGEKREAYPYIRGDKASFYAAHDSAELSI